MTLTQKDKELLYSYINKFRMDNGAPPLIPMVQFEMAAQAFGDNLAEGRGLHNIKSLPDYHKIERYIPLRNYTYIHTHDKNDQIPILQWMTESQHRKKLLNTYHYCGISRSKTHYTFKGHEWVFILGEME